MIKVGEEGTYVSSEKTWAASCRVQSNERDGDFGWLFLGLDYKEGKQMGPGGVARGIQTIILTEKLEGTFSHQS